MRPDPDQGDASRGEGTIPSDGNSCASAGATRELLPVLMLHRWDDHVRGSCHDTLRLWGFRAFTTSDGEEALRTIVEHQFCAMIVDLDLDDVDALSIIGALQKDERFRQLVVIATTASGDDSAVRELAREHGCDAVLSSPVDADVLAAELEAVMAHRARRFAAA